MSASKKSVFLVPRSLTWDKLCALYLAVAVFVRQRGWSFKELLGTSQFDIAFDGDSDIPADAIDLDTRKSYKDYGVGSATEKVVTDHQLDWPGVGHLVRILGVNNATGNLRNDDGSLVLLIRELFNVGAEKPSRQTRLDVVNRMWPVVEAYFLAAQANENKVSAMANPFTLANYEHLLTLAGVAPSVIRTRVADLERASETVADRQDASRSRAVNMPLDSFEVPILGTTSKGRGHYVVTDDTRYAALHFKQHGDSLVLIVRRRNGNAAIFCRGQQDFTVLHQALEEMEPGLWFHENRGEGRSPMLLNGSTSRHAESTKLSKPELIRSVQQNHRHVSRTNPNLKR